jgi:hypothetical protein
LKIKKNLRKRLKRVRYSRSTSELLSLGYTSPGAAEESTRTHCLNPSHNPEIARHRKVIPDPIDDRKFQE